MRAVNYTGIGTAFFMCFIKDYNVIEIDLQIIKDVCLEKCVTCEVKRLVSFRLFAD